MSFLLSANSLQKKYIYYFAFNLKFIFPFIIKWNILFLPHLMMNLVYSYLMNINIKYKNFYYYNN